MTEQEPSDACCYCGQPSQWNFEIHADSNMKGKTKPLCDECGSSEAVTPEMIWAKIKGA